MPVVCRSAEGETAKKELHAYLSMDNVCHVYWTVGYTKVTDGVEEAKEEARRVQAPVGQQTVFSYQPCTTELVAGKGASSFKSAQAMMNPAEPPLLTGDNATFVAWTDVPAGDCQYSFDYFWDGLRKEDALSTVKKSGDKLKWSHRGAISFIGTHEVTLELYQSCDGGAQERVAVACGTFSIM